MIPLSAHLFALIPLVADRANHLWYSLPLIVVVSLVYAATRHEQPRHILAGATRIGIMIGGFMLVVFGMLYLLAMSL